MRTTHLINRWPTCTYASCMQVGSGLCYITRIGWMISEDSASLF